MKAWYRKLAAILLLIVPLHGMATTLSAFTCFSGGAHPAAASHSHEDGGGSSHKHDDETGTGPSGHLNCHHFFSAMTTDPALGDPPEPPAYEPSISLLFTLFIPERPQRPPRI